MAKRGAGGRFIKRATRSVRKVRRRSVRFISRVQARGRSLFGGIPKWAKPSTFTAATGVGVATFRLVLTPLPNGDNWVRRLVSGYGSYKTSGNLIDIMALDAEGNDVLTIAAMQLKQNAVPAIGTVAGFGIVSALLKKVGL